MSAIMVSDAVSNGIVCSFRRFPHSRDGYYEIRTEQGKFLSNADPAELMEEVMKEEPLYDFVSDDGINHKVWRIGDKQKIMAIEEAFQKVPVTYIADGHHRAASAAKVGMRRIKVQEESGNPVTGKEPYHVFFISTVSRRPTDDYAL